MSHDDIKFPFCKREQHIRYFLQCLKYLPRQYLHLDTNRLTLVYFAVQSLDILGFFDDETNCELYKVNKEGIIGWIYSLQIIVSNSFEKSMNMNTSTIRINPAKQKNSEYNHYDHNNNFAENESSCHIKNAGFQGGTYLHFQNSPEEQSPLSKIYQYHQGHLAMTYSAICTLITLGDDLHQLDKKPIIQSMKKLQLEDGSFQCRSSGSETDLRFVYCACAISYLLNDWSGVDIQKAVGYIRSCRSYDGAYGLVPGQESHGGPVYCAIASLALMGELDNELGQIDDTNCNISCRDQLIQWCVFRQMRGMQGRPNKNEDTCYSFWIGACLDLLGFDHVLDQMSLNDYVLRCQSDLGGFTKIEYGAYPDMLHSFYSLAWLSLSNQYVTENSCERSPSFNVLNSSLGICNRHLARSSPSCLK